MYISIRGRANVADKLAIIIFNQTIEKDPRHGDSTAREERVVIHTFTNFDAGRRVDVACKE